MSDGKRKKTTLAEKHPQLVSEWDSVKNAPISPWIVTAGSNKKVWWKGSCGHEWESSIKNRANGSGCPYCSGNKVLKGFNDFASKHPELAREWSEKNLPKQPDEITEQSNSLYWWCCKNGHEWKARPADRAEGHGCPYCAGKILKGYNDLATTHPDIMKEWSDKNTINPDTVSARSVLRVTWKCGVCGHEWQARICTKVGGTQCPECRNEQTIARYQSYLAKQAEIRAMRFAFPPKAFEFYLKENSISYLKDYEELIGVPLQFYLPNQHLAVEFSGKLENAKNRRNRNYAVNELCLKNKVCMIRILEKDSPIFDNCVCVVRQDNSQEALGAAIQKVFELLKIPVEVNIGSDLS